MFANHSELNNLANNNKSEFVKISREIFECFDLFSQKSEQIGKIKIDQWAQIQLEAGPNAITLLFVWTTFLYPNVSFPLFNNFSKSVADHFIRIV